MVKSKKVLFWLVILLGTFYLGVVSQSSGLIDDFFYYWEDIVYLSGQHMQLSAMSGSAAIILAVPLGIWLSRPACKRIAEPVMQVLNIGTTVPTLAILALSMSFLGIGSTPAVFALCVATLLPIVRNTYVGLLAVPDHLKEAANGMGMTPGQILLRVEIPNALYVIFAGIRTALTINVGTVPLAFLIGGGGLGELIFTGIDLDEMPMLLAGAIPTSLLAVMVDISVGALAFFIVPKGVNPLRMNK
ncbi:ABC transporter permease [Aliamphritea hakodatensis]|uniref:ABC transporter permease n=1 Tax=Aliamphritea hakodatensis TaxID=2895352 RepID=UPI0022FD69A9|nr:ABC transporter permease [Aliamphritea hakodatensis]